MTKRAAVQATSNPMCCIQHLDPNHHSWKVTVRRVNQLVHQYLTDSAYGGTAPALTATMAWCDLTVVELTGVDCAVWRRELTLRTNTADIVGAAVALSSEAWQTHRQVRDVDGVLAERQWQAQYTFVQRQ